MSLRSTEIDVSALGGAHTLNLSGAEVTDVSALGGVHTLNLSHVTEIDVSKLYVSKRGMKAVKDFQRYMDTGMGFAEATKRVVQESQEYWRWQNKSSHLLLRLAIGVFSITTVWMVSISKK